jgi:hypothetical protein
VHVVQVTVAVFAVDVVSTMLESFAFVVVAVITVVANLFNGANIETEFSESQSLSAAAAFEHFLLLSEKPQKLKL